MQRIYIWSSWIHRPTERGQARSNQPDGALCRMPRVRPVSGQPDVRKTVCLAPHNPQGAQCLAGLIGLSRVATFCRFET